MLQKNEDNLRSVLKVKQEDYEEVTDIENIQIVVHRLKSSICSMLGLSEIVIVVTSTPPKYIIDSGREKRGDLGAEDMSHGTRDVILPPSFLLSLFFLCFLWISFFYRKMVISSGTKNCIRLFIYFYKNSLLLRYQLSHSFFTIKSNTR